MKDASAGMQPLDRGVLWLATHWLALVNLLWGAYVGLPLAAPLLMEAGWPAPARIIYALFRPACHQRPERSFFLGGARAVYSPDELAASGVNVDPLARAIGDDAVGWKVAICQRDVAIYGSLLLAGLAYGAVRRSLGRWHLRFRVYLVFLLPMALDGTLQLFGLYESTWGVRVMTGAWFGFGSVALVYPYLDEAFRDVRNSQERRLRPPGA